MMPNQTLLNGYLYLTPLCLSFSSSYSLPLSLSLSPSPRENFNNFLKFMGHLSHQCDRLLGDTEMMTFLQRERYDIAILDAFNPCSFILARKLCASAVLVTLGNNPSCFTFLNVFSMHRYPNVSQFFRVLFMGIKSTAMNTSTAV